MAREWRRLLVTARRLEACGGRLVLQEEECHYLRRVLRLRSGGQLALVDGVGRLWSAHLESTAAGEDIAVLEQPVQDPLLVQPSPCPSLGLAVALPRQDADVLVKMVCELGVDHLTPLRARRSGPGPGLRPQRQESILREALEQCERLWLPRLDKQEDAKDWLTREQTSRDGPHDELKVLATTRRSGLEPIESVLGRHDQSLLSRIWVAVGPEGGWADDEEEAATSHGWLPVSLSDAILRTATAAVVAVATTASWRRLNGLSCGTSPQPSL